MYLTILKLNTGGHSEDFHNEYLLLLENLMFITQYFGGSNCTSICLIAYEVYH